MKFGPGGEVTPVVAVPRKYIQTDMDKMRGCFKLLAKLMNVICHSNDQSNRALTAPLLAGLVLLFLKFCHPCAHVSIVTPARPD